MFHIRMGQPEVEDYWTSLADKVFTGKASKTEVKIEKLAIMGKK